MPAAACRARRDRVCLQGQSPLVTTALKRGTRYRRIGAASDPRNPTAQQSADRLVTATSVGRPGQVLTTFALGASLTLTSPLSQPGDGRRRPWPVTPPPVAHAVLRGASFRYPAGNPKAIPRSVTVCEICQVLTGELDVPWSICLGRSGRDCLGRRELPADDGVRRSHCRKPQRSS